MLAEPDIILSSTTGVVFNVHREVLRAASEKILQAIDSIATQTPPGKVELPETTDVVEVILHAIYETTDRTHQVPIATLAAAVGSLDAYGLKPMVLVAPDSFLYEQLVGAASEHAFTVFALASQHNLEALAVHVSRLLLTLDIQTVPEEEVATVHPKYLNRLLSLFDYRMERLRALLSESPVPHARTASCEAEDSVRQVWIAGLSTVLWKSRPGQSQIFHWPDLA